MIGQSSRIILRLLAAIGGGYAVAAGLAALTAVILFVTGGMPRSEAVILASMLAFLLYLGLLIWAFAIKLGWFNVQGYTPLANGFWLFLHRLILPSLALSTVYIALIARITRTSVIEVMGEDFIRTARSKGLTETGVLLGHALRNAAVPIATVVGLGIALLISGVVVTESVFNIPGLGRLVVEAVLARDYPVIQGLTLFFAFVYVFINLVVDCAYTVFDPRIRY